MEAILPPQSVELEEAVLGAVMLETDALLSVCDILQPDHFYKEAHTTLYAAIIELKNNREPVDLLTVTNKLKSQKKLDLIGGAYYITSLTNRVASGANAEYHARIILQHYIRRELIRNATAICKMAYDPQEDVFDTLDKSSARMQTIYDLLTRKGIDTMPKLTEKAVDGYQKRKEAKRFSRINGIPSGLSKLDLFTGGWQKQDLIIVASRPAMGKTALACQFGLAACAAGKKVLFMSLEMSAVQLTGRLLLFRTGHNAKKFRDGFLDAKEEVELNEAAAQVSTIGMTIDDSPSIDVHYLRSQARKMKAKMGLDLILIDYLQLMTVQNKEKRISNREQEIAFISRNLKAIAKDFDVPVIALAQLGREVERRGGDKRPLLSDLRESGQIEADADVIIFPHRPMYYGIEQDPQGNSWEGIVELIFAKHRNGATTRDCELCFNHNESITQIWGLDELAIDANSKGFSPNLNFTDDIKDESPF